MRMNKLTIWYTEIRKTMNTKKETLVFAIVCIFGVLLVFSVYGDRFLSWAGKTNTPVRDPITSAIDNIDPPQLTDLLPDRPDGPHQKFISEDSCLKCHRQGVEIPGLGIAPKIKHEIRSDCGSCHKPKRT